MARDWWPALGHRRVRLDRPRDRATSPAVRRRNRRYPTHCSTRSSGRQDGHDGELATELALADVVILACPLTEQTRGLVDADFLAAMRPDAVLVNVARGGVVNDDALLAALDHGTIGSAILDVFDPEPLPESSPFWTHENVTVTSHIAGAGAGFLARNDQLFIDQLDDYLAGRPLRLEVVSA